MEERYKWEEIIRSKLKDFEVDTMPDDWKAIESRLSGKKVVLFRRWYYVAAAIMLFLLITGGYFYFNNVGDMPVIAETGEIIQNYELRITNYETEKTVEIEETEKKLTILRSYDLTVLNTVLPPLPKIQLEVKHNYFTPEIIYKINEQLISSLNSIRTDDFQYIAGAALSKTINKSGRRWSFGAGGGSYSVGTNGGGFVNIARSNDAIYAMRAFNNGEWYMEVPVRRDNNLNDFLVNTSNSISENNVTGLHKVDLSHKQPISLGIGIGYAIDDRWSLQSGLVYTLLSSEWKTEYDQDKYKQLLHFVGVPLGLSYKISEWNKIRFYASAGGMSEWNVGGNIKTKYYFNEDESYRTIKEYIRMKELQWSVNVRIGATYPVIKFVNVYMEGGANYYFNNNSSIETIRSDKPFHVSLQAGLRFGF